MGYGTILVPLWYHYGTIRYLMVPYGTILVPFGTIRTKFFHFSIFQFSIFSKLSKHFFHFSMFHFFQNSIFLIFPFFNFPFFFQTSFFLFFNFQFFPKNQTISFVDVFYSVFIWFF